MARNVDQRRDAMMDLADAVHEHAERARLRGAGDDGRPRGAAGAVPALFRRLPRQATRVEHTVDTAVEARAGELLTGGRRIGGALANGYYLEPTVFGEVDNASALAQTETFGPVVSVIRFSSDAEAVRIANASRYGLDAFVHTRDLLRAHRVTRQLEAGSVWVNTFSDIEPQGPYGAYKQSGFGRTGGVDGLDEFVRIKNIRIGMR